MNLLKVQRLLEGAAGHTWFLTLGITIKKDMTGKEILLSGLASLLHVLTAGIDGFMLHPVEAENKSMRPLQSHLVEEGFPPTSSVALKYFKTRNKRVNTNSINNVVASSKPSARTSQEYQHDDDAGYSGPNMFWGTVCASADINLKSAVEDLFMDLEDTGLVARWKRHQSAESSSQIIIPAVPRDHCPHGIKEQLLWHLKDIEVKLITKGKVDHNLIDTPLAQFEIDFKNTKKGRSRNSHEAKLSLNNLQEFRKNGCYILTIEGSPEDWPRMAPLWNQAHKEGRIRLILGRKSKLVQVFNGQRAQNDRATMQRIRRFHVIYCDRVVFFVILHLENVNKEVEVRMKKAGDKRPYKFTSILREMMNIKVDHEGESVSAFQSCIPCTSGLDAGTARVTVKAEVTAAIELVEKIKISSAAWMWGYLNEEMQFSSNTCKSLMESFDIDAAALASHSVYNAKARSVVAEFMDEDGWLEEGEEEFGITDQGTTRAAEVEVDLQGAREGLEETLHVRDDISNVDRDARSRATNHVDGATAGNSTQQSMGPAEMARNHKERALENAALARENAELKAKQDAERESMEAMRAEIQGMREAMARGPGAGASNYAQPAAPVGGTNNSSKTSGAPQKSAQAGGELV